MLHNKFGVLNICMSLLKALVQFSIALIVPDEWAAVTMVVQVRVVDEKLDHCHQNGSLKSRIQLPLLLSGSSVAISDWPSCGGCFSGCRHMVISTYLNVTSYLKRLPIISLILQVKIIRSLYIYIYLCVCVFWRTS